MRSSIDTLRTSESESDRRTPERVLRSLTRQLAIARTPQPIIHSAVLAQHSKVEDDAKADGSEIMKANSSDCIDLILAVLEDNPATLVIDAIHELEEPHGLIGALHAISSRSANVVKILLTSRSKPAILRALQAVQFVPITENQNKADIRFVADHLTIKAIADRRLLTGDVTQATKDQIV